MSLLLWDNMTNTGVSTVTSTVPNPPHVNVQSEPRIKSQDNHKIPYGGRSWALERQCKELSYPLLSSVQPTLLLGYVFSIQKTLKELSASALPMSKVEAECAAVLSLLETGRHLPTRSRFER